MPSFSLPSASACVMPFKGTSNGNPRDVWPCGSKKISACITACAWGFFKIGEGEVVKIALRPQGVHPLVIDVEKILKIPKIIGSLDLIDRLERQLESVLDGLVPEHPRLQRAFDMKMQLDFRKTVYEGVVRYHRNPPKRHRSSDM